jgi:hypothetical protein
MPAGPLSARLIKMSIIRNFFRDETQRRVRIARAYQIVGEASNRLLVPWATPASTQTRSKALCAAYCVWD